MTKPVSLDFMQYLGNRWMNRNVAQVKTCLNLPDDTNGQISAIESDISSMSSGKVNVGVTVNGQPLSGNVTLNASNIAATTDHNYVTDSQQTAISHLSGTNSGDETASSIKSKLGQASTIADGYIASADFSNFAGKTSKSYVDAQISTCATPADISTAVQAIVGMAPSDLDTLKEIADRMVTDENSIAAISSSIAAKEPAITAGTSLQYLRGDKTLATFAADVRSVLLTGLAIVTNTDIAAGDTVLQAFGKIQGRITGILTALGLKADLTGGKVPIAQVPTGTDGVTVALGNHTHSAATSSAAGFMSAADKIKLDSVIADQNYLRGGSAPVTAVGIGASVDLDITYNAAFISLSGKTANDIQVIPIINGVGTLLGSITATVKAGTKTLTGCKVTIKNAGLGILSTGTVEVIAFFNGVPA